LANASVNGLGIHIWNRTVNSQRAEPRIIASRQGANVAAHGIRHLSKDGTLNNINISVIFRKTKGI
jgi:hypothetical protein